MFSGDFGGSGRNRGGRSGVSREDVVAKARAKREARAQEREQAGVTVRIQSTIRGWLARRQLERTLREDFSRKQDDIEKVKQVLASAGREFVAPAPTLDALVLQLNAFYKPRKDDTALICLAELCHKSLKTTSSETPKLELNNTRLDRFVKNLAAAAFSLRAPEVLLKTLEALLYAHPASHRRLVPVMVQNLAFALCKLGLPTDEYRWPADRREKTTAWVAACLDVLESSPDKEIAARGSLHVLSIAVLEYCINFDIIGEREKLIEDALNSQSSLGLGPEGVPCELYLLGNLLSLITYAMTVDRSKAPSWLQSALIRLGNLLLSVPQTFGGQMSVVWLGDGRCIAMNSCLRAQLFQLQRLELCRYLTKHCTHVLSESQLDERRQANDRTWESKAKSLENKSLTEPSLKSAASKSVIDRVKDAWASSSWSRMIGSRRSPSSHAGARGPGGLRNTTEVSRNLAEMALSTDTKEGRPASSGSGTSSVERLSSRSKSTIKGQASPELALHWARAIAIFLWMWPPKGANPFTLGFLNALSFVDGEVPTQLWALYQSIPGHQSARDFEKLDSRAQSVLLVLCSILHHRLLIADDAELYEMHVPLHRNDIESLVLELKQKLFHSIISTDAPSYTTSMGESLTPAATSLLATLYERHSRRPLCETKVWLVPQLNFKDGVYALGRSVSEDQRQQLVRDMAFGIPFAERVRMFQKIIAADRAAHQPRDGSSFRFTVRRSNILEDGFRHLSRLGPRLKGRLYVVFVNDAGMEETGIDAGGLFKEFWTTLSGVAFNSSYGLFATTDDQLLYPNPRSGIVERDHLALFEFLGCIVGKALYEEIVIQPRFARFFLSKLLKRMSSIGDLPSLDVELYRNLTFLKTFDGDVRDLSLTFSVTEDDLGEQREVDLIPGGRNLDVTSHNKYRYVHLMANYYLNVRTQAQSQAFMRGFSQLINPNWVRMFSEPELQTLISGAVGKFSLEDLRRHTSYANGFHGMDRTVSRFWKIFAELPAEDQARLLRFVTSCERAPLLGFSTLSPPFTLQKVSISSDDEALPSASTCFNVLKLPTYSSSKVMKDKLLTAIHSGAGFELT